MVDQLKQLWNKYGYRAIGLYLAISFSTFAFGYMAVRYGVNFNWLIPYMKRYNIS